MDLIKLTATQAIEKIGSGELKSETLIRAYLERIQERDKDIKAWVHIEPELAIKQAKRIDSGAFKGGALRGIPLGIKDVIDTFDMPSSYGSPIYSEYRPFSDAACVSIARNEGAIIMGKTATAEFANSPAPETRNPHNLLHTPGGSSSGSAAAVADFMTPLALGTQTGGSIIRPAAFCGVVGYKPTFNRVNRAGLKFSAESLDTIGFFARNVKDISLLAHALIGQGSPQFRLNHPPRIGLYRTTHWDDANELVQQTLIESASKLKKAGASVVEIALSKQFDRLYEAQNTMMFYEAYKSMIFEMTNFKDQLSLALRERLEKGKNITHQEYSKELSYSKNCINLFANEISSVDILITLSAPGEAPKGLHSTGNSLFNRIWTLLGVPCIHIPIDRSEEKKVVSIQKDIDPKNTSITKASPLPVGFQIIGHLNEDVKTLEYANWIESVLKPSS